MARVEGFLALVQRITTRKLKETQGSLGCAELRAAARGEMSVFVFEKTETAGWSPTDARVGPPRFDPAVFGVVRGGARLAIRRRKTA
ncbi:MAG TPA: hypothetical protein VJO52_14100 [Gemmatimonadaceae bacterium]|nr:hypothetical protein [Gemmatimonadaceae bacterium]